MFLIDKIYFLFSFFDLLDPYGCDWEGPMNFEKFFFEIVSLVFSETQYGVKVP